MSAHAASSGLFVTTCARIRRIRRLPVKAEMLVKRGDVVAATDCVAEAMLPGMLHPINAAQALGLAPSDLPSAMVVKEGDTVTKGQVLAGGRTFLGFGKIEVRSPCDGTVESVSPVTGQVMIAETKTPLRLHAYLPGKVADVDETGAVEIESIVSLVQGIFGVGGEQYGRLQQVAVWPIARDDFRDFNAEETIFFSPEPLSFNALESMRQHKIRAAVAGSVPGTDLMRFAGKTLNPACTGDEGIGLCIVLTEGFGRIPMAVRTANLLARICGEPVSVNGATQVRAGVIRPELIGPPLGIADESNDPVDRDLSLGDTVRIVRGKSFGTFAVIRAVPADLQPIGSGAKALVYEVEISPNRRMLVPRANVESI